MAIRDYQNYEENEFNASKKSVESKGETKKLELPFDNFWTMHPLS